FIYGSLLKKESTSATIGFSTAFKQFAGETSADEASYVYGSLPEKYESKQLKAELPQAGQHPYAAWREQLRLSTRFRAADTLEDQSALRRGRLAHQLLSRLNHREDLPLLLAMAIEDGSLSA